MKTFQYTLDGHSLTIRLDEHAGTIADIRVDDAHPVVTEAEMPAYAAAISLALLAYEVEVVHDDETGVITLQQHESSWNHPSQLMNRL
mgnify:CR=1 FL=1